MRDNHHIPNIVSSHSHVVLVCGGPPPSVRHILDSRAGGEYCLIDPAAGNPCTDLHLPAKPVQTREEPTPGQATHATITRDSPRVPRPTLCLVRNAGFIPRLFAAGKCRPPPRSLGLAQKLEIAPFRPDYYTTAVGRPVGGVTLQSTITHLVTAAMLVHSMLGCCVHHAHGAAGEVLQSSTPVVRSSDHTHWSQQCSSHNEPVEHSGRSCQADPCVFVRQTASSTGQQLRSLLGNHSSEPGGPGVLLTSVTHPSLTTTALFSEHVRSHLAKRLLLI